MTVWIAGGLRTAGVPVAMHETIDAVAGRVQVRAALRAAPLEDDIHNDVFDRLVAVLFPVPARRAAASRGKAARRSGPVWARRGDGAAGRSMRSRPPWPGSQDYSRVHRTGGRGRRDAGRAGGHGG